MISDHRGRYLSFSFPNFLEFFLLHSLFSIQLVGLRGNKYFFFFFFLLLLFIYFLSISSHSCSLWLQVVLPFGIQREVETHLRLYQSHNSTTRERFSNSSLSTSGIAGNVANNNGLFEHQEPLTTQSVVMEKILRRKSLQLRSQQQDWQVFFPL